MTSELLWRGAVVCTLLDVVLVALLARGIPRSAFLRLRGVLIGTAAGLWSGFGVVLVRSFWDTYYSNFLPNWLRSGGILLVTIPVYGALALVYHWLALRLPGNVAVSFVLLGGLGSIGEHLWGILGPGILRIPMLQGVGPVPILAFAVPEYVLYWGVVLGVAGMLQSLWERRGRRRGVP